MFAILTSCDKEHSENPENSERNGLKGDLIGWITAYNEFGVKYENRSGILVTLEGSNPLITATTDSNGKYQVFNLSQGTYNISVSKAGFTKTISQGFSFTGGAGTPRIFGLSITEPSTLPATQLTMVKDTINKANQMYFEVINNNNPNFLSQQYRYFLSNKPNVSSSNFQFTSTTGSSPSLNGYKLYLRPQVIIDHNIYPTGSTVYIILYGDTSYKPTYLDEITGFNIYPSISPFPSNVVSFVAY